jgi:hypothetical protein
MPLEFTRCESCGIIFPHAEGEYQLCPKCRHEDVHEVTSREQLRALKNTLRDVQSRGMFLTMHELSAACGVDEETIWHFIQIGDIDTASLSDPDVRSFVARRKKELMKGAKPAGEQAAKPEETPRTKVSGFHLKVDDAPDKG